MVKGLFTQEQAKVSPELGIDDAYWDKPKIDLTSEMTLQAGCTVSNVR